MSLSRTLINSLRSLSECLLPNILVINPSKSKTMFFGHNDHYLLLVDILIDDCRIDIVDVLKCLSIFIGHRLTFEKHINDIRGKILGTWGAVDLIPFGQI